MVILMKSNKTLVLSKPSKLYQQENAVDNITIYVPEQYEEFELKDFIGNMYYTDPGNVAHSEALVSVESDKEGFLEFKLPVTTKITNIAGDISLYLSFVHTDLDAGKTYVLKTSNLDVTIEQWDDYFKYVSDESLSAIDNKIAELDTRIAEIKAIADMEVPDDLAITAQGHLQLTVDGATIGDGVDIVVTSEDDDGKDDGVLDLDVVGI